MRDNVKEYYGKVLKKSGDLKTNACCTVSDLPDHIKSALSRIHPEVASRYYGCGLICPDLIEGKRILDLGCGAGRDCYALSFLAGKDSQVVGVDMTEEQLEVANRYIDFHMNEFGYPQRNIEFKKGYIEELNQLGFEEESFDLIVSNCVINLSPDKKSVLEEAYKLLKPGGEMYFSDVYSDRRIPSLLADDPVLYGECLSGALYWNDFINLARQTGFLDPRLVDDSPIELKNKEVIAKIGHIKFYSATYRLFKIEKLQPACENYGQAVIYQGTIPGKPNEVKLDSHHKMESGKVFPVCGNTYRMLNETRYKDHFKFLGSWDTHFGIFENCGLSIPFQQNGKDPGLSSCC